MHAVKARVTPGLLLGAVALLAALAAGCGFKKSKDDAEKLVAQHYALVGNRDWPAALGNYGEPFFARMPRERWATTLAQLHTKLGPLKSYRVAGWNVSTKLGEGTKVELTCDVFYQHHKAEEHLVLHRKSDDAPFKLVGHTINSQGLLMD